MKEEFCLSCESFNSKKGYDYSGGPGVTVCAECGRKNTIIEVPEDKRDLVRDANSAMGQMVTRLMTELKEGRLSPSETRTIIDKANPSKLDPSLDYRTAEEYFFELLDEVKDS